MRTESYIDCVTPMTGLTEHELVQYRWNVQYRYTFDLAHQVHIITIIQELKTYRGLTPVI